MEGQITWKKDIRKDTVLIIFKLDNGDSAKTYIVKGFKNAENWVHLQIGNKVGGLIWFDEKRKLISADSAVYPLN